MNKKKKVKYIYFSNNGKSLKSVSVLKFLKIELSINAYTWDFCPDSFLEEGLPRLKSFLIREQIKVGQNAHQAGHPVDLANIQKLKRFHFES